MAFPDQRTIRRPPLKRWFFLQSGVLVFMALAFLLRSQVAGLSALLGGLIFLIPNIYFVARAFRYSGARSAKKIMSAFYQGESVKLILCAVLFAAVFKWIQPLDVVALFITFAIMLVTNWFTPVLASGRPQQS